MTQLIVELFGFWRNYMVGEVRVVVNIDLCGTWVLWSAHEDHNPISCKISCDLLFNNRLACRRSLYEKARISDNSRIVVACTDGCTLRPLFIFFPGRSSFASLAVDDVHLSVHEPHHACVQKVLKARNP